MEINGVKIGRFWNKVEKTSDCWLWIGGKDSEGYGRVEIDGKRSTASRLSWIIHFGDIEPKELFVCHTCDNPSCVNPDHLFLGTQLENIRDAQNKGRLSVPEKGWKKRINHCPKGHEYTEGNTYRWKTRRICRTCHAAHERARRAKCK